MNINKGFYHSPLGIIEISSDGKAVTALSFTEKEESSPNQDAVIGQCIRELDEYFKGARTQFEIPLELKGTDFQKKVWQLLRDIGYGKTVTYQEIAIHAGNPQACRAVGAAIGKNPVFIMVPCHRVIGKSGALTGFAGGLERKQWLLDHEKQQG